MKSPVTLSERNAARSAGSGQPEPSTPRLSEGTELIGEYEGSGFKEQVYLARRADGQVIQFSRLLYLVAAEADGQKDLGQIARRVSEKFGRSVSADNVRFLVEEKLRPLGVLATTDGSCPELARAKPVLALNWRAPILPEGLVRVFTIVLRPLFLAPVVIAMLAGFVALDYWLFFVHGASQSAREVLYRPEHFLTVYGLALLSVLFHEFGHATACRYGGARPGRIGVGLYLVWPVFYNDVTDAYRLGRTGRLRVDLGGVYFNVVFALATAGAYFVSGFEPLLLAIFLQQVQMLYQFMPYLRLDGYYVVSDLTGVPDLFARIKPILASMIPGREADGRVEELKPWVRAVVAAWVLTAIPALLYLLATLIVNAPLIYSTAWDSFWIHYDKIRDAFGGGRIIEVAAGVLRIVLLVVPVAGVTLIFALIGGRMGATIWSLSGRKPAVRVALMAVSAVAVALALFALGRSAPSADFPTASAGVASFLERLDDEHVLRDLGIALLALAVGGVIGWRVPVERDDSVLPRLSSGALVLVFSILLVVVHGLPYYL